MAGHRNKSYKNVIVSEEFRIKTETIMRNFVINENMTAYEFPNTLTNVERAWIHNYIKSYGLNSRSYGREPNRKITVSKPKETIYKDVASIGISKESKQQIQSFLCKYPVNNDKTNLNQLQARFRNSDNTDTNMGQLTFGVPQLPLFGLNNDLLGFRMNLPIWSMREYIMENIISNQVIIVKGETGSGKTTQIPQFIVDYNASIREKCRIICTQPRRISAISVAERVAKERGENTGQAVGYHIRLESCVGPKTTLIYCTNGILLRTLMNGDACLSSYTHIIVDEIHERDRFSDFLLICLRECLVNYPHLRLILMSATIDVTTFTNYFNNAPVIHIPGRVHNVYNYYLDDILPLLQYESSSMRAIRATLPKESRSSNEAAPNNSVQVVDIPNPDLCTELDDCIEECFERGSEDSFNLFLQFLLNDHVPINYQHSKFGYTVLMAAAAHGNLNLCVEFLKFGANIKLRSSHENLSAGDWAFAKQHIDIVEMLKEFEEFTANNDTLNSSNSFGENEIKLKLDLYQRTVSDETIDFDLLHSLLYFVHSSNGPGSILVFLAGYDDIVTVREKIQNDSRFRVVPFEIFALHGMMQISDQHRVFNPLKGKRKIILSTNIAETSITIDDVVFVIDSGKVKEKTYDALTGICSLQCCWISQSAAKQRAGRAGRTQSGYCFHLFSRVRYDSLQSFATPEMLRMPLHALNGVDGVRIGDRVVPALAYADDVVVMGESDDQLERMIELCLQTKMLAPRDMKIGDFLCRALEPPSSMAVKTAIKHLQEIGALDEDENLTILGQHLVDLPVEPRLAKMLIYAVIFRCIDPILTIVAFLGYRDPFVLPNTPYQKNLATNLKKQFSMNTFSDQMILLKAFQAWQDARLASEERLFCSKNFLSAATMDMVVKIRSQLLAQLRAAGFVNTRPPGDIRELNENANNWAMIKAVLTAGFFPNIAYIDKNSMKIRTKKENKIALHISSALRGNERNNNSAENVQSLRRIPTNWLIYEELSRSNTHHNIRSVTCVSALTIALFVDTETETDESEDTDSDEEAAPSISNNWVVFHGAPDLLTMISGLRNKLNVLVTKKIANPHRQYSYHDNALLQTVAIILQQEDEVAGLHQPIGIGQRPKIMNCSNGGHHDELVKKHHYSVRYPSRREEQYYSQILSFKRVNPTCYNRYEPQILITPNLEDHQNGVGPSAENFESNVQIQKLLQQFEEINMENVMMQQEDESKFDSLALLKHDNDLKKYNGGITAGLDEACAVEPTYEAIWMQHVINPEWTAYCVIKTGSVNSIDVSIGKKVWVFPPYIEKKLKTVYESGKNILLVFSVQNSRAFQAIARLVKLPDIEEASYNIQSTLDWVSRADITFSQVQEFFPEQYSDGDQVNHEFGVRLWQLFTNFAPPVVQQSEPTCVLGGRPITKRPF